MMTRWLAVLLLLPAASLQAAETDFFQYAEIAYAFHNPDDNSRPDREGLTLIGELPLGEQFHIFGRYTEGDGVRVSNHTLDDWYTAGIGWHHEVNLNTALFLRLSYDQAEGQRPGGGGSFSEGGLGYHAGIRAAMADRWLLSLQFGEIDTLIKDYQLVGEAGYAFSDSLSAQLRIRDYDDLDLTTYEIGFRFRF